MRSYEDDKSNISQLHKGISSITLQRSAMHNGWMDQPPQLLFVKLFSRLDKSEQVRVNRTSKHNLAFVQLSYLAAGIDKLL